MKSLLLESASQPKVRLRPVGPGDLEELRLWKNANKRWFFFKGDITPAMQKEWFEQYLKRADDVLFIVEDGGRKLGTLGIRLKDGAYDVYNVVAAPSEAGKGYMKSALTALCARFKNRPVGCLVLKGNPAAKFYEACGFRRAGGDDIHDAFVWGGAA
ncbi:MAG: GNAT family N-acetyltransferase [Elusimicrobiota bacterium]|nr:MAG: GNAT family N-acetyltransferase [Elusimicrobiota bacterium]